MVGKSDPNSQYFLRMEQKATDYDFRYIGLVLFGLTFTDACQIKNGII